MQRLLPALPSLIIFGVILCFLGIAIVAGMKQRHRDRRRIIAQGTSADALITKVEPNGRADRCRVRFSFQPQNAGPQLEGSQRSTLAALKSLGLAEGSNVRVYYLPKSPRYAFIKALTVAERVEAIKPAVSSALPETTPSSVYFISYVAPGATKAPNAFRWTGDGDITISPQVVHFTAYRNRPLWFPKLVEQKFPREAIANVEVFDNAVRCEISEPYTNAKAVQFWAVNAEEAKAIGGLLPDSKTATFAPQLAERADFNPRLRDDCRVLLEQRPMASSPDPRSQRSSDLIRRICPHTPHIRWRDTRYDLDGAPARQRKTSQAATK
jgi:hypothetical protein